MMMNNMRPRGAGRRLSRLILSPNFFLLLLFLISPPLAAGILPNPLLRFREAKMPGDLKALSAQRQEEVAGLGYGVAAKPFVSCEGLRTGRSIGVVGVSLLTGEIIASADIGLEASGATMSGSFIEATPSGVGRIKNVLVAKKDRGKGLGRDIMREVEKLAVARKLCALELEVDTANEAAFNLYRSLGYESRGIESLVEALAKLLNAPLQIRMYKDLQARSMEEKKKGAAESATSVPL